jgi:hypothetical protein
MPAAISLAAIWSSMEDTLVGEGIERGMQNTEHGILWFSQRASVAPQIAIQTGKNPANRATAERSARKGEELRAIALM